MIPYHITAPPMVRQAFADAAAMYPVGFARSHHMEALEVTANTYPGPWLGLTSYGRDGSVRIRLNITPLAGIVVDRSWYRVVACHELGHALGLQHNWRWTSCMNTDMLSDRPDTADLAAVADHLI